jgi:23S rRNA (guanosine2251-2'-O)-methyltransferase
MNNASLKNDRDKKEWIAGFHAVEAVLHRNPERVLQLYYQEGLQNKRLHTILILAKKQHIPQQALPKVTLDQWSQGLRHQGVLIQAKSLVSKAETDLFNLGPNSTQAALFLILDEIQDPHNLGACLRSANAAGVDAVIITQERSAGMTPTVQKVAAGAAETTPVIKVVNLANTLKKLKNNGIWIYGMDARAKRALYDIDLTGPVGLVLGGEGKGLRRLTKDLCDELLAIPLQGTVESLNVSVAAGICLFEAVRQRWQQ